MRRLPFLAVLAAHSAGAAVAARAAGDDRADLIVHGATIRTMNDATPTAEAFAVRAGRFVYVGSREGAEALRGAGTQTLSLAGRTVLPGLIDAHLHATSVGLALHEADLTRAGTYEEVVRRTVAFARTSPDQWIVGDGWDQNLWPGKQFPTHAALSAALPDRPVVLFRVDGHALLANAAALRLAGIDAATADPPGGRILRDGAGAPTGVLVDNAVALVRRVIPAPTPAQLDRALRSAIAECHRYGVTSICEARTTRADLAALEALANDGALDLRVYAMLDDDENLLRASFAAGPRDAAYDGRLWVRAVKLFIDGALGSRGAALLAPYSDDPSNVGLLLTTPGHVRDTSVRALAAGFQVCTHAIGDRGNRIVLDAYEAAFAVRPVRDHRFRIEHAQVLSASDIPRFAQLGVIPSMQTTHQISDMAWAQSRLGAERVGGAYAWRSLLDTGAIVPNGTDAPIEPVNTLRTYHAAIARADEANSPPGGWHPEQRMTRDEALRSMTIWPAQASFREHVIGSIETGKYADFVVMDRDWLTIAADEVMRTRIVATYLSGRRVFDGSHAGAVAEPAERSARRMAACGCAPVA